MGIKNINFEIDLNNIFTKEELNELELKAKELGTTLDEIIKTSITNISSKLEGVLGSNITEKDIVPDEEE